jgi:hypothetical protein
LVREGRDGTEKQVDSELTILSYSIERTWLD